MDTVVHQTLHHRNGCPPARGNRSQCGNACHGMLYLGRLEEALRIADQLGSQRLLKLGPDHKADAKTVRFKRSVNLRKRRPPPVIVVVSLLAPANLLNSSPPRPMSPSSSSAPRCCASSRISSDASSLSRQIGVIQLINPTARLGKLVRRRRRQSMLGFVKDWAEKKMRRHLMRARNRRGFAQESRASEVG
jgi:hypothetical protein